MRTDEVLFSFSLFSLVLCFQLCSTGDTLKAGQKITLNSLENLVSSNRTFELGFFPLSGSSSVVKSYLGIWYHGLEPQTVVWVANRDKPVLDSSGVFRIAEDGNLVIEGASSESYWSSKIEASSSTNRTVKLLESGNLVLMDDNLGRSNYTWQSFQHPTDTFLPGMKMDASVALISWRNSTDPAPGNFTFTMAPEDERGSFAVQKLSQIYWDLDELDRDVNSQVVSNLLGNTTTRGTGSHNFSDKTIFTSKPYNYKKSRLLMNSSGELQFLKWDEDEGQWEKHWWGPADECDIHDYCGSFGICNRNNHIGCKCLPGFAPIPEQSEGELQGHGCVRKSTSCINTDVTFLNLTNIKVGNADHEIFTETEAECQSFCISKCPLCQAYSYNRSTYSDRSPFTCNIWTQNLSYLVEEYDRGRDLSILVKRSDIAPTAKTCEPCGTYEIPYPLSTGPNCGDSMYNKFNCTKSTGQVNFMMPEGISYQVTRIEEDTRTFFIQADASYSCSSRRDQNNTPNFPFNVVDCIQDFGIVKFSWQPAPEPPCNRPMDCMNWPHSTCRETRCHCDLKYRWNNSIMSCTQEEPSREHLTHRLTLILTVTLGSMAILACITAFVLVRRKKKAHKLDRASTQIQESLYESEKRVKGLIGLGSLEEKDIEGIEVPCYTFASILAATDNFTDSNKLGRGGYGPVYKAWKLWTENKLLDLMDPSLGETCNENQFIKCALIGLLCIQDEPGDRPTMSNVLSMLDIEAVTMPIPTPPTFFVNKRHSSSASSSSKPETSLQFDSSYQEGR
ncbi:hypothetical protein JHK85_035144 [Glycine max]|nr:hypothetical protein JHK85_035144 [Glycine max]